MGSRLVWGLPLAMILGVSLTKLLLATAGGGSFPIPGVPGSGTVTQLTSAPNGGWTFQGNPMALAHNGYTYAGFIDGSGNVKLAVFTAGALVGVRTIDASFEADDHDNPTLSVDPINDKLLVAYAKHLGPNMWIRKSTSTLTADPDLSDGFTSRTDIGTTLELLANRYMTYASLLYTNNADGSGDDSQWLFYRAHVGGSSGTAEWHYTASDDGGATWNSAGIRISGMTYAKVESDGVGRIDMGISEAPGGGLNEGKIWHIYRESAAWHESDGTNITASLPLGPSDMTEVFDGTGAGDEVWIADIAYTTGGDPVIAFVRYPGGDETDHRAMYAAWTGTVWSVHEIAVMGHPGGVSGEYPAGHPNYTYHAGLALDHDDPSIAYVGRWISGQAEMFRYTTADGGATFTAQQLTTASSSKQFRPVGVRHQDDIAAIWLSDGFYNTYVDYSLGMAGYIP